MEESKTSSTKKSTMGNNWMMFLLENIFGSVQTFVDGALGSVHEAAHVFMTRLALRAFVFFFTLAGFIFFFSGASELLSAVFRIPGMGGITVGLFMLLLSLVIHVFSLPERTHRR